MHGGQVVRLVLKKLTIRTCRVGHYIVILCYVVLWSDLFNSDTFRSVLVPQVGYSGFSLVLRILGPRYEGWAGRESRYANLTPPTCRVGNQFEQRGFRAM